MNSDKLLVIALEAKGITNVEGVIAVARATGNVEAALETILGIYEEQTVPQYSKCHNRDRVCTFMSFDRYQDQVKYSYDDPNTKGIYVLKEHKDDTTIENMEDRNGQMILSHKTARLHSAWDRVNSSLENHEIITGFVKCRGETHSQKGCELFRES